MATISNIEQYRYRFFIDKDLRLFQCIDTGLDYNKEDKPEIVSLRMLEEKQIVHLPAVKFERFLTIRKLIETEVRAK